jgi:hypothetical protein
MRTAHAPPLTHHHRCVRRAAAPANPRPCRRAQERARGGEVADVLLLRARSRCAELHREEVSLGIDHEHEGRRDGGVDEDARHKKVEGVVAERRIRDSAIVRENLLKGSDCRLPVQRSPRDRVARHTVQGDNDRDSLRATVGRVLVKESNADGLKVDGRPGGCEGNAVPALRGHLSDDAWI